MSQKCRSILLFIALVIMSFTSAQGQAATDEPANTVLNHVVVLETQWIGTKPLQADDSLDLISLVDVQLTDHLSRRADVAMVDRQALDKVLDEHQLMAAGHAAPKPALSAELVDIQLRPFWAAGVMIAPRVTPIASQDHQYMILIEAIAAQSGQRLAQTELKGKWDKGQWQSEQDWDAALQQLLQDVAKSVVRHQRQPLVEVARGQLQSDLSRLQWMVDDLADALETDTEMDQQVNLLVPRQTYSTKEERLLRLMGLSQAQQGDAAAGLRPIPDGRINFQLQEHFTADVMYEMTPLTLKLTWQSDTSQLQHTLQGRIGEYETLRQAAMKWVTEQRHKLTPGQSVDDVKQSLTMARQELEMVSQWESVSFADKQLEAERRQRVVRHALRASHLDPTSEDAAYTLAMHADAYYAKGNTDESLEFQNRVIAECQRYLERFSSTSTAERRDEIRSKLSLAALNASHLVSEPLGMALSSRPNTELYHYASIYVPILLNREIKEARGRKSTGRDLSSLWTTSWMVRLDLIMNCPADRLQGERTRLRETWKTEIEPLEGNTPPWEQIELFFHIRTRNWRGVRENLQRLADRYDFNFVEVWKYDYTPIVPHLLRAAGDPQWSTWQPSVGAMAMRSVSQAEMNREASIFWSLRSNWLTYNPALPASKLEIKGKNLPEDKDSLDYLTVIDKQLWLVAPSLTNSPDQTHKLYLTHTPSEPEAATVDGVRRFMPSKPVPLEAQVEEVDWPLHHGQKVAPTISCMLSTRVNGQPTLLLGTAAHGLARFDRHADGSWQGRWYTSRTGMPGDNIIALERWQTEGHEVWLLRGSDVAVRHEADTGNQSLQTQFVWTIDPNDDAIKVHAQGSDQQLVKSLAEAKNGRLILATFIGTKRVDELDAQVDLKTVPLDSYDLATAQGRLWKNRAGTLTSISPQTLLPVSPPIGGQFWWPVLPQKPIIGQSSPETFVYGALSLSKPFIPVNGHWPLPYIREAVSWNDRLAMISYSDITLTHSIQLLVFYRPAPAQSVNWEADDLWSCFLPPKKANISALHVDENNQLWLSSEGGLLRVNQAQLDAVTMARGPRAPFSTFQWQELYQQRTGWQNAVIIYIYQHQWEKALEKIDQARNAKVPDNFSPSRIIKQQFTFPYWRARVLVEKGDLKPAMAIYDEILRDENCTQAMELWTRLCQFTVLHRFGQWAELIELYESTSTKFPQLQNVETNMTDDLGQMLRDARKALALEAARNAVKEATP